MPYFIYRRFLLGIKLIHYNYTKLLSNDNDVIVERIENGHTLGYTIFFSEIPIDYEIDSEIELYYEIAMKGKLKK